MTQTKETKLNKLETKTSHGWSTTFGLKRTKLPGNNFKNPGPLTCCSERDLKRVVLKFKYEISARTIKCLIDVLYIYVCTLTSLVLL